MFSSIGWGEILILLVAALVVLGPERLPEAARWTATTLRRARDHATGTAAELKREFGPEFDDLRAPLAELRRLRTIDPRALVTCHLLDGEPLVPDEVTAFLAGQNAEKIDPGNFGSFDFPTPAIDLTKTAETRMPDDAGPPANLVTPG
ncbi:Sec-independent protein translocase protein TatB [Nocardia sp. NPDC003963]